MTLVELLVALTVFGVLLTGALRFLATQNRAVRTGVDRATALQAARFVVRSLELDLATLGTNLAPGQPGLVVADGDAIAFYGDHTTNLPDDPFAAYFDPDAPGGQVSAPASSIPVPRSGAATPDTAYAQGGTPAAAELLIFFFAPDTTTDRSDDYALHRQVNGSDPERVAGHLLAPESGSFLRYVRLSGAEIDSIAPGDLPLVHATPAHLSAADTGASAVVDSIRAVRVHVRATNGRTGDAERIAELGRLVRFPNAGLGNVESCGERPLLGVALDAGVETLPGGENVVELEWTPAVDESGGEEDVVRYVLWRRSAGEPDWGDPYLSIPPGESGYTHVDAAVSSGETYRYGLAAQDCTPSLSDIAESDPVTVP